MVVDKVNLAEKFALFNEHWTPKLVGKINDFEVKIVKVHGEFVWHHHDHEDEMFMVIEGSLTMQFRDKDVVVHAGEFIIVPHGVEHRPVADEECLLMLIEPSGVLNTGNVRDELTVDAPEEI